MKHTSYFVSTTKCSNWRGYRRIKLNLHENWVLICIRCIVQKSSMKILVLAHHFGCVLVLWGFFQLYCLLHGIRETSFLPSEDSEHISILAILSGKQLDWGIPPLLWFLCQLSWVCSSLSQCASSFFLLCCVSERHCLVSIHQCPLTSPLSIKPQAFPLTVKPTKLLLLNWGGRTGSPSWQSVMSTSHCLFYCLFLHLNPSIIFYPYRGADFRQKSCLPAARIPVRHLSKMRDKRVPFKCFPWGWHLTKNSTSIPKLPWLETSVLSWNLPFLGLSGILAWFMLVLNTSATHQRAILDIVKVSKNSLSFFLSWWIFLWLNSWLQNCKNECYGACVGGFEWTGCEIKPALGAERAKLLFLCALSWRSSLANLSTVSFIHWFGQ